MKVETVQERLVDQLGNYTATVEAQAVNNISAAMSNRIKAIYVDEGMRVSKGQRLVVLDDVNTTNYQIQVDNAKANLNNVQVEYNRALELYKIGGGTKQQLDQVETQLINAKNALAAAQRTYRNAAENTVLTSPISGVVTKRNYDPGDMTGQLPILTISQVQPVKIVINVSESELPKVHKGMPATILFDTFGAEEFKGTITMTMPTVDPATRTFGVEITVPNPDSRILPGMFGRVQLNLGQANHVVVPDRAVVKQQGSGQPLRLCLQGRQGGIPPGRTRSARRRCLRAAFRSGRRLAGGGLRPEQPRQRQRSNTCQISFHHYLTL